MITIVPGTQFQQGSVWQFDDIVMTHLKGRDVHISMAYAVDHPILSALQNWDWDRFFGSVLTGVDLGLRLRGR